MLSVRSILLRMKLSFPFLHGKAVAFSQGEFSCNRLKQALSEELTYYVCHYRWKGLFLLWIGCTEDLSWSYCQVGCNKKVQVHSQMSQSSRTLVTVFYSVCFRTKCYILRLLNGIS